MSVDKNHIENTDRLKITEIFYSIQGEAVSVGIPTVFIRLTGCPLRCGYCDTAYAFTGGEWMSIEQVTASVESFHCRHITVTGGEPLAQANCLSLLATLCDQDYKVSLETSGAIDVSGVDPRVIKVMDIKTPGSGEEPRNLWDNLAFLTAQDQIKFVLCDQEDYHWAKSKMAQYHLHEKCEVLMSPSYGQLTPKTLAEWILKDALPVRFQIQLHKQLWGTEPGH